MFWQENQTRAQTNTKKNGARPNNHTLLKILQRQILQLPKYWQVLYNF